MKIKNKVIKNILAVRNDRLGEFLLNIPAFIAIKQRFPGSKLTLAVNPYLKELSRLIDSVDDVITWENKKHGAGEIIKFSKLLRNKKFDLCIIFNPSREFNIISFLSRIPIRIGYARKCGFLLTHKIEDKKQFGLKHEIEYNLELASLEETKIQDKNLSLKLNRDIIKEAFNKFLPDDFKDFLIIHPWTSDPVKQWPMDNFRDLAFRIAKELGMKILIIGREEGESKNGILFKDIDKNVVNLTGATNLTELAAILTKCRLLISSDSGPVHLACAVGAQVVALFKKDIPGKSSRRWGPWGEKHIVIEKNNLADISVDEVFNKVKEALQNQTIASAV